MANTGQENDGRPSAEELAKEFDEEAPTPVVAVTGWNDLMQRNAVLQGKLTRTQGELDQLKAWAEQNGPKVAAVMEERDRLRAKVAELEAKAAEDAIKSVQALAQFDEETVKLRHELDMREQSETNLLDELSKLRAEMQKAGEIQDLRKRMTYLERDMTKMSGLFEKLMLSEDPAVQRLGFDGMNLLFGLGQRNGHALPGN